MPQKVLPRLYFARNGALNSDRVFANVILDHVGDETAQGGAIGRGLSKGRCTIGRFSQRRQSRADALAN
jgi:hypothetical protein